LHTLETPSKPATSAFTRQRSLVRTRHRPLRKVLQRLETGTVDSTECGASPRLPQGFCPSLSAGVIRYASWSVEPDASSEAGGPPPLPPAPLATAQSHVSWPIISARWCRTALIRGPSTTSGDQSQLEVEMHRSVKVGRRLGGGTGVEAGRGVSGSGAVRAAWGCAPSRVRTSENAYLLRGWVNTA
jgi:hypothetical protein